MKFNFIHKNKNIGLDIKRCNFFQMFRGLMFTRCEKARALLLFDFKKSRRMKIHSWFVFFHFVAIWLDDKNKVLEIKRVKPFRFCVLPKKKFCKLIEIPINKEYDKVIESIC